MHIPKKTKKKPRQLTDSAIRPLTYQEPVIAEHVKHYKRGEKRTEFTIGETIRMEGSDMGSGKTYIACFTALRLNATLAVVCPKTSIPNWEKAIKQVGCKALFVNNYESLVRSTTPWVKCPERMKAEAAHAIAVAKHDEECMKLGDRAFEIAPLKPKRPVVENNDFEWANLPDDVLVAVDEAHRCKGEASVTSELLIALRRQSIRTMCISASSACSPAEMRALGFALGLHSLRDFIMWAMTHGCITSSWGNLQYCAGDSGMRRLHDEVYPKMGCRIRIADLGDAFPETQITADAYSMEENTKKINKVYDDMNTELARWEAGMSTSKGMNPLTIILRARQKVELLKVPAFVEMAKDAIEDGHRVLIFLNFTESVIALAERLKTNCIFAGFNKRERNYWLNRFQSNEKDAKVMILNIAAGAESINCHDLDGRFPRYSLISPSFSAYKMIQATGRPHRAGGKSKSIQRIVYAANTIEQRVCSNVQAKLQNLTSLNDGDLTPAHLQEFLAPEKHAKAVTLKNGMSVKEWEQMVAKIKATTGDEDEEN